MDLFSLLLIELLIGTAIYYIVFFSFIFYWHLVRVSYIIVPLIFTFEFFVAGFFVISIITLVVKFLPYFINLQ